MWSHPIVRSQRTTPELWNNIMLQLPSLRLIPSANPLHIGLSLYMECLLSGSIRTADAYAYRNRAAGPNLLWYVMYGLQNAKVGQVVFSKDIHHLPGVVPRITSSYHDSYIHALETYCCISQQLGCVLLMITEKGCLLTLSWPCHGLL